MDEKRMIEIELALRKVAVVIDEALREVQTLRQELPQPSLESTGGGQDRVMITLKGIAAIAPVDPSL
jgi:hypothetical protein